jgi:ketosteroid isomerase-like protein
MKSSILLSAVLVATVVFNVSAQRPNIFAPDPTATGPVADLVKSMVTAFNNHDTAFFQKTITPDAVWLDEDGHHLIASVWMNRLLSANPPRKLTITNLRVNNWADGGWAGFNYVLQGTNQVKGTNSLVFKKTGNDWQIVLIHGAVDTAIVQH